MNYTLLMLQFAILILLTGDYVDKVINLVCTICNRDCHSRIGLYSHSRRCSQPSLGASRIVLRDRTASIDGAARCYSCYGISNPHECQVVTSCSSTQECFTRSYISDVLTVKFDLGCQDKDFCKVLSKRSSISSRDAESMTSSWEFPYVRRKRQLEAPLCTECCDSGEHCNVDLCRNSLVSRPPGLKCYDCGGTFVNDPADCNTVRVCASDQSCYVGETVTSSGSQFTVNCLNKAVCKSIGNNVLFGKRDRYLCRACCDSDHCNIDYCSRTRPLPTGITNTTQASTKPTTPTTPATTTMKIIHLSEVQTPFNATREAESFPLEYRCQVQGLPVPTYSWEFVGNDGMPRNVDSMAQTTGIVSVLTLDPVLPASEGSYTCTASNSIESLKSTGYLTVFTKVVAQQPTVQTVDVAENKTVALKCNFTAYPAASIKWYSVDKNGILLSSPDLQAFNNNDVAVINAIQRDQTGVYACVGDNGFDNTTSKFDINVQYVPEFVGTPPDELRVPENGQLIFSCMTRGNPSPTYFFSFVDSNSTPSIVTGAIIFSLNGTLVVDNVNKRYDGGTITCRVENSLGDITHSAKVVVM